MRAIVFDLDGTLLDSRLDIARSILHAVGALGHESRLDVNELGALVGRPLAEMLRAAVPHVDRDSTLRGERLYRDHYMEHCLDTSTLFSGVEEGLRSLVGRTLLGCATTKRPDQAERIIAGLHLDDCMDLCLGTSPGMAYKPAPDLVLAAAQALSLEPGELLYVGDTSFDLRAAHAAGSPAAWAAWGYGDENACLAERPELILRSPAQIRHLAAGRASP